MDDFAREHGITENAARAFITMLRALRPLTDEDRLTVIALIAKCQVEPALRKIAFAVPSATAADRHHVEHCNV